MTVYWLAEFRDKDAVAFAIRTLRAAGMTPDDLDVFSEEPVELSRRVLDRPSRLSFASVAGAIAFGVLATGFMYWAQHNYRLVTGGMPIFSFWATGVITYEMTMLGAVVATFVWFLRESGLARRRKDGAPVPEVNPGSICLRIRCAPEQGPRVLDAMRRAGAIGLDRREQA
jgi:hypothetical protein